MQVQPYLFFTGRCEEAGQFYVKALGAKVPMLMRYRDSPDPHPPGMVPPGAEDKVMHMHLQIGSTSVMAADDVCSGTATSFSGFSLSLTADDEAHADALFAALADGGQVRMPLTRTFFAKKFGMLADRFGVGWMILVAA